ncbi:hypothetical protein VPH35_073724 [Triticum aestivum]
MLDGLDDMDVAEDVPFDELIGMQGLVFHLVENAITICITYKSDRFKRMKSEEYYTINTSTTDNPPNYNVAPDNLLLDEAKLSARDHAAGRS